MNPEIPRMQRQSAETNPCQGTIHFAPIKTIWFLSHTCLTILAFSTSFNVECIAIAFITTVTTLCLGHSIGLHRLLIHRSFKCSKTLEYLLVHLGTLVGMQGPHKVIYMHEIRDWSQRHKSCHKYFIHQNPIWKDFIWQMLSNIRLQHPPKFTIEKEVQADPVYRFMQKTWMLQQLPIACILYLLGGIDFILWGISARVTISLLGHWIVGYFSHNTGLRTYHLKNHAVQGYNIPAISLITMGESLHNNHHAYPNSAKLGITPGQLDPGWWVISTLEKIKLVWDIQLPKHAPTRPECIQINNQGKAPKTTNTNHIKLSTLKH